MSPSSKERERDDALVASVHNASRWFVENRNIAWAVLVVTVLGGVFGYMRMPKAKDPHVEVRVTLAICPWPGAGVDRIEELVTRRIERAVAENPNIEKVESTTLENLSLVFITLSEKTKNRPRELDDLEGRLNAVRDLPQGAGPIKFLKDFGDTTTLMLTVASPPVPQVELELRAQGIQRAIEAVRGGGGDGGDAGRASVVVGYPPAIDARLARNAAQLVWSGLVDAGLGRDERLIEGPSFIGVDLATSATDETLTAAIRGLVGERLRGSELHPDVWRPAIIRDPQDTLARIAAVAGDRYSYRELDDFTDQIQRAMQTLPIVARVTRSGVLDERVFLEYSQGRLASYGFRQGNLAQLLGGRNITFPGGEVEAGDKNVRIDPSGELESEAQIGDVMVPVAGSQPAYLRDLVDVVRAYDGPPRFLNYLTARGRDGELRRARAITLAIDMRKGEQIDEFARQVDAKLAEVQRVLPEDLILRRTSDQPLQVRENVHLFMNSLYEAIVLIVVVALIGFWDWRGAAIMALSIPITLAMTFAGMYALGVDVQQISIASLIIALGLLVDNPVVAGDAIKRALADGRPPIVGAWLGPTKLAAAILFATITNIAAYLPFLTVGGDTGIFIRTLPIVMTVALVASLIVARTFIPLLGYYLLRPAGHEPSAAERRTRGFGGRYARVVAFAIEHRKTVFAGSLVVLAGWLAIASRLKPAFFPHDLQYLSVVDVWLPEDAPLSVTREKAFEADAIVREVAGEALDSVTLFIGGGGPRFWFSVEPKMQQLNYAQLVVQLEDKEETSRLVRRLQPELSRRIAGARVDVKELETAKPIDWPVAVRIAGEDPEVLRDLAERLEADLRALPQAERVRDDWGYPAFKVALAVDPDRANLAGVTNLDVAVSSASAMNGIQVSQLRDGRRMIPIVARLRASERSTLADVEDLYVHSDVTGQTVPLRQVSRLTYGLEAQKVRRRDHFRAVTVSCHPTPPFLPSETLAAAQPAIERLQAALPPGYTLTVAGELEEQQKGFVDLAIALLLSVTGIYLSLVFQFRSVAKPLVVFAAIVYGAAAALVSLVIMGTPFGFMAFLGTISLIGVIVSHVIVLFDFIEEAHHLGQPLHEALVDAGIIRLRPVMITVAATVLGLVPLAMHGGPLWEPLCYAQIGGLTVATFLTLLLVPVIYTIFVEDLGWIRWEQPAHPEAA